MSARRERPDRATGPGRARTHLNYGEAIRRLRQELGMSRDALAAQSGVSPSYLYEIERGYKRPSTDVLASLAEALGRSPSDMLFHIEAMSEALPQEPHGEPLMESPRARREWAVKRLSIEPQIQAYQAPSRETGTLRSLLAVLDYLSEEDLRILLALARRLAGRGG